ncbi:MAG: hypothetical protein AB7P04_06555 [Bacteriovoracia bacterium]
MPSPSKSGRGLRTALTLAVLGVAVYFAHREIHAAAPAILNSDLAVAPLTSDLIRQGHWTFFQLEDTYGGNFLTWIRTAWVVFSMRALGTSAIDAHFSFNYFWLPWTFAALAFALGSAYFSFATAAILGLAGAVGLNFFYTLYGVDFHVFAIFFGFLVLTVAGRYPAYRDPWRNLNLPTLFGAGVVAGFAHYTSRMADIFLAALFVPWRDLGHALCAKFGARTRADRAVLGLGLAFVALYAYLQTFGQTVGTWNGRPVKIWATPNLHNAALCFAWVWVKNNPSLRSRRNLVRGGVFLLGLAIGFMPELISMWMRGHGARSVPDADFHGMLMGIGQIPGALRAIFTGGPESSPGFYASWLLLTGLTIFGIRHSRYRVAVAALAVAMLAFILKRPYADAPPRYLVAVVPPLWLGLGAAIEGATKNKVVRSFGLALVAVLLLFHLGDQLSTRRDWAASLLASGGVARDDSITAEFRRLGVPVVLTENFWEANRRTLLSNWAPPFVSDETTSAQPYTALAQVDQARRVGILLSAKADPSANGNGDDEIEVMGRRFKRIHSSRVGDYRLHVGERIP